MKKVNYVQTTGSNYLNTGIRLSDASSFSIEMVVIPTNFYDYNGILFLNNDINYESWIYSNGRWKVRLNGNSSSEISLTVNVSVKLKIEWDGTTVRVYKDDILQSTFSCSSMANSGELALFRCAGTAGSKLKIKSATILKNGNAIRNYIPVIDSGGVACLYDTVSGTYSYSATNTAFSYGELLPFKSSGSAVYILSNYTVVGEERLNWDAETPAGTSINAFVKIGSGSFAQVTNGGIIPNVPTSGTITLTIMMQLGTTDTTKTPTLTGVNLTNIDDTKIIVLGLNTPNISGAIGNAKVSYDGQGSLAGYGGPAEAFEGTFTPSGLTWKGHQNDEEHIEMSMAASVLLKLIAYHDTQENEHVEMTMTSVVKLTNIHDL